MQNEQKIPSWKISSWANRRTTIRGSRALAASGAVLLAGMLPAAASAAVLCVNPQGHHGCFSSIGAAVAAAAANDTVQVQPGTYRESVVIGKPLSLIGAGRNSTVIDAAGRPNGIFVDGIDNSGLADVVISGFTVENANFEGIVVANASAVTVWANRLANNDAGLQPSSAACPGIPSWETAEGFDCGEAIHLSGVDHSSVARNLVEHNAGGVLLSDDTGSTHDNLITANIVRDNGYDCGITLASHPPAAITGSVAPLGVYHNTISDNFSSHNGTDVQGEGAGVGIFDSVPGARNYGNVVVHNRLTDNGMPGVAMHSHAPDQDLTNNVITGNYIAGNGADAADTATPGSAGINVYVVVGASSSAAGTLIFGNVIRNEDIGIAINNPDSQIDVHLNDFMLRGVGVDDLGPGAVDARQNWWGCSGGPGESGCATVVSASGEVLTTPALDKPFHDR